MTAFLGTCALMCILASPVALAEDVEPAAQSDDSTIPAAGELDIRDVIASFSERTHKRFLLDPRVRASVTLIGLNARDITYPVLARIFSIHGFSAHERDGVIVVLPDVYDRQVASLLVPADNIRAPDVEVVTAVLAVRNISAAQLVPILRPLMPQQAHLAALVDRNALIIVDRAGNVRRLVAIVEALDGLPAYASPSAASGDAKDE